MRKHTIIICLLALFLGGGCKTYDLEPRWRPLEQIVERPRLPFVSDGVVTTTGPIVWVTELDSFIEQEFKPGTVAFDALLMHEQAHSFRQGTLPGRLEWERVYLTDPASQWEEEQIGWYFEIRHQLDNGEWIDMKRLSQILSRNYRTLTGDPMVSEVEALLWLHQVVSGQWSPPADLVEKMEEAHGE